MSFLVADKIKMEELKVNAIMNDITDDSSLCIIREALTALGETDVNIHAEILKGETWLKEKGVTFEDIRENKHELEGQVSDDANWEAGRLSALYDIKNQEF